MNKQTNGQKESEWLKKLQKCEIKNETQSSSGMKKDERECKPDDILEPKNSISKNVYLEKIHKKKQKLFVF